MTIPSPRRTRVRRCIAVAGALLVTAVMLPGRAAPGDPEGSLEASDVPLAVAAASDVPGQADLPSTRIANQNPGIATLTQASALRSSKMVLTIKPGDPIWTAIYPDILNYPVGDPNPTSFRAACQARQGTPCVPFPFDQPECATEDPATQVKGSYFHALAYPLTPLAGGGAEVGMLAQMDVNLVAFGSIPASARVTLSQPRIGGTFEPLKAHVWSYPQGTGAGHEGCDPTFKIGYKQRVEVVIEGQIEISLSDLVVDGIPVDVGSSCRTESLVDLKLWSDNAAGSYFPVDGGPVGAWDGLEGGSLFPLDSPYYGEDNGRTLEPSTGITIPAFAGCGAGGEDLSSIVTAMASGPNNPISATQGPLIRVPNAGEVLDISNPGGCGLNNDGSPRCPFPGPAVPPNPPLPGGETP